MDLLLLLLALLPFMGPLLGAVTQYSTLTTLDQAEYDSRVRIKAAALAIHPQFFEQANTIGPAHVAYFDIFDKLSSAVADTLLTGTYSLTDPDPDTPTESQVGITAYERGKLVAYMQAPAETFKVSLPEAMLRLIEINLGESLDVAAAYYLYSALSVWTHGTVTGPLTGGKVLEGLAELQNKNVATREQGLYAALISPYTKYDLFADTDNLKGFVPASRYANPDLAFNFELGTWLGFRWAVGSSAYHATVTGVLYDYPLLFGANAFGQANGYAPTVVVSPPYSGLRRKTEVGWKAQRGYGVIDSDNVIQLKVQPTNLG